MGQRVDGSTGQQVTFTFTILYMIADDARLTPPRCKKHTAYDDTRFTPYHCKKHTASFARSTGKFPSVYSFASFVVSRSKYCYSVCVVYPEVLSFHNIWLILQSVSGDVVLSKPILWHTMLECQVLVIVMCKL